MKLIYSIFAFLVVFSGNSFGSTVISKISFIQVNNKTGYPNLAAIKPVAIPSERPSCATDALGRFAFWLDTDAGKAAYSMALAAQASGKELEIYGSNNCIGGGLEEVEYIRIKE